MSTRREILKLAGAAPLAAVAARRTFAQAAPRVLVVGGGFGGATCARYLKRIDPALAVTLIEPASTFVTCPFSNTVIGGLRDLASITFDYRQLHETHGVEVIQDQVMALDPAARSVTLAGGQMLSYDRLVLSPGIELRWDALEGYDQAAAERMPHAWKAGPQTTLLRGQLEAMADGGVVAITVPEPPFRCPPGPYERASLIAHYLKTAKPHSKLLILDASDTFSKQPLFTAAWQELYPDLIEWLPRSQGGQVVRVDPDAMVLHTDFEEVQVAVANVIPPQRAAGIARAAGLDEGRGWCAVDAQTFESTVHPGVHLLGDAILAGAMPKSGFSANSQAKVCAAAIAALLRDRPPPEPVLINTCYSLVAPDYGISVGGPYEVVDGEIVALKGVGGLSPLDADHAFRRREADYARSWYANITADMFGVIGFSLVALLLVLAGAAIDGRASDAMAPLTDQPGDPARGERIVLDPARGNCLICHPMPIPEVEFQGDVGPDLAGVGSRYGAGEIRLRVVDAKRLNPDSVMPAYHRAEGLHRVLNGYRGEPILTAQEVEDVVAYLMTLEEQP